MKSHTFVAIWVVLVVLLLAGCSQPAVTYTTLQPETRITFMPQEILTPTATQNEIKKSDLETNALMSLQRVDNYPLYTMSYSGSTHLSTPLTHIEPDRGNSVSWGCSLFAALGDDENRIYGRNFDWEYSPALLVFTDPPDGYASASMVDIAYLPFSDSELESLTDLPLEKREPLLYAVTMPFDGMNEQGLAIGMAAVPEEKMQADPEKETIGSLRVIREILDHSKNVDEGIDILAGYNIDMQGEPPIHYLLADRSGEAALVEFAMGKLVVKRNEQSWHLATNFLIAESEIPSGKCWRYDLLNGSLRSSQGIVTPAQAINLLSSVSQENTQWSVTYLMSQGTIEIVMGREFDQSYQFKLAMGEYAGGTGTNSP